MKDTTTHPDRINEPAPIRPRDTPILPGPRPRRSNCSPRPNIQPDNIYGPKNPIAIEKEIKEKQDALTKQLNEENPTRDPDVFWSRPPQAQCIQTLIANIDTIEKDHLD